MSINWRWCDCFVRFDYRWTLTYLFESYSRLGFLLLHLAMSWMCSSSILGSLLILQSWLGLAPCHQTRREHPNQFHIMLHLPFFYRNGGFCFMRTTVTMNVVVWFWYSLFLRFGSSRDSKSTTIFRFAIKILFW